MLGFIIFVSIILCVSVFIARLIVPEVKKEKTPYKEFFTSSQISIGGSGNTQTSSGGSISTSNINGHVTVNGNIKSLTINGKKIQL